MLGLFLFLLGLCIGSFASALIYRIPRGIPWVGERDAQGRWHPARSICPPCGRTLTAIELIPVLSWLFQRGRCQCGKTRIPWTYPALELACGVGAVLFYLILT